LVNKSQKDFIAFKTLLIKPCAFTASCCQNNSTRRLAVAEKANHTIFIYRVECCNILSKLYGCTGCMVGVESFWGMESV